MNASAAISRFCSAGLLAALLLPGAGHAQAALDGEAWQHADQAYRAYERRDFERAVREAEAAARLRPDLPRLAALADTARRALRAQRARQAAQEDPAAQAVRRARELQAQGRLEESLAAWDDALRLQPGDAQVRSQRGYVARSLALPVAQEAYDAYARGDMARAALRIGQALAWDPQPLAWHALHVDAWLAQQAPEAARAALQAALQRHPHQPALLLAQAYVAQAPEASRAASDGALRALQGTPAWPDAARLATDLALAAGDAPRALALARSLREADPAGGRERELLAQALQGVAADAAAAGLLRIHPPAPSLLCTSGPGADDAACQARYAFAPLRAVAEAAYARTGEGRWDGVLQAAAVLVQWQPAHIGYRQLQVAALSAAGQPEAARDAAREGLARMDRALWQLPDTELATLAHVAQDYALEARAYADADAARTLAPGQLQDAGYAAERVGDARTAAARFRRAIDAQQAHALEIAPQKQQDLRVAVGALERTWGASAGVFAAGGGSNLPGASASRDRSVQGAAEWFWRPEAWRGYGTHADVYLRGTGNLYSAAGERTGWASLQPIVGLRIKPLADHNVVAAAERLFKAGAATRDDWLVRLAYSGTRQILGPVEQDRWTTTDAYAEAGRYLRSGETYFTSELRHGPQWRLAARPGGDWALWGYGVLAVDRDNVYATPWAASAGLGVGLRRWLRDDAYNAGRSWIDLTLQYREHLHGDRRNSGWVLRLTWNH